MEQRHDCKDPIAFSWRDNLELPQLVALGDHVMMAQHHCLGQAVAISETRQHKISYAGRLIYCTYPVVPDEKLR